ncbi:TPA: hypothetical protein ACKPW6_000123 [Pseudomonas aeruginosa]|nr:hypothetical protein [Pseudomonas aeruginosa]
MPRLYFGNGIYSQVQTNVYRNEYVDVPELVELMTIGQTNAEYVCSKAVQRVPLTSVVLDFSVRAQAYDKGRLSSVIVAFLQRVDLDPLSVSYSDRSGEYKLENGYHRFIASVLFGFPTVPIDKAARIETASSVGRWVPKLRAAPPSPTPTFSSSSDED